MGLLDKIKFWKKDDMDDFSDLGDFGLGDDKKAMEDLGKQDFGAPPEEQASQQAIPGAETPPPLPQPEATGAEPFPQPAVHPPEARPQSFSQQYPSYQQPLQPAPLTHDAKDIEIISAKLDALRATLESINQRLANLERIAQGDQQKRRYEW